MNFAKFFFLSMFVLLGGLILQTYMHEAEHQQIFRLNGVESKIVLNPEKLVVNTIPNETYESQEIRNSANIQHAINEAVAYNVIPILTSIALMIFLGFTYVGEKK